MNGYCYFILGILVLAAGYFTYGRVLERIFRPDASRQTPAVACTDGVDYVVMPRWRVFLIQLLNIAGLGPIFGAVMGVLYGPAALLWIVFGCILGGMAHDYFSGMISLRHKGENLPEILGRYLGNQAQWISRAVCIVFSVLVGVVFAVGPAAILSPMTGWSVSAWVWIIFGYYFLATILPIQAIMGKVYPLFSVALIIMVMGILGVMLLAPVADSMPAWMHLPRMEVLPDLDFFHNRHPADFPLFPVMFITIACGAISGFHSLVSSGTSSKTVENEKDMLKVGYGAMILESLLAVLALCVAGAAAAADGTPAAGTPFQIFSRGVAGFFEMFGVPVYVATVFMTMCVSALALTSLDAVARIGRMSFQELFSVDDMEHAEGWRKLLCNVYFSTIITLVFGFILTKIGYANIWPLFGSANQLLSALVLATLCVFLKVTGRNNKMIFPPLIIMLCVTFTALVQRLIAMVKAISTAASVTIPAGETTWGAVFIANGLQLILAILLIVLGLNIVVHSFKAYQKAEQNSEVKA